MNEPGPTPQGGAWSHAPFEFRVVEERPPRKAFKATKRLEGTTQRAQGVPEKEFVGREVDGDRLGLRAFPR